MASRLIVAIVALSACAPRAEPRTCARWVADGPPLPAPETPPSSTATTATTAPTATTLPPHAPTPIEGVGGLGLWLQMYDAADAPPAEAPPIITACGLCALSHFMRRRPSPDPARLQLEVLAVSGGLPARVVVRAVHQAVTPFHACHALVATPARPVLGRVRAALVVAADGRVADAQAVYSSLAKNAVVRCMLDAARRLELPASTSGATGVELEVVFASTE
jgi:hypothetical protein